MLHTFCKNKVKTHQAFSINLGGQLEKFAGEWSENSQHCCLCGEVDRTLRNTRDLLWKAKN